MFLSLVRPACGPVWGWASTGAFTQNPHLKVPNFFEGKYFRASYQNTHLFFLVVTQDLLLLVSRVGPAHRDTFNALFYFNYWPETSMFWRVPIKTTYEMTVCVRLCGKERNANKQWCFNLAEVMPRDAQDFSLTGVKAFANWKIYAILWEKIYMC